MLQGDISCALGYSQGGFICYSMWQEKGSRKFQDIGRTSYLMGLYLQKTRNTLRIQLSSVRQWESNLWKSSSHLELVNMGWKQNVSDSLCHSLKRMAEAAVERFRKQKLLLKAILFPTFPLPQHSLYFSTEIQNSHFPSENKINQEFLNYKLRR